MPQGKLFVAAEVLVFDFELFRGDQCCQAQLHQTTDDDLLINYLFGLFFLDEKLASLV